MQQDTAAAVAAANRPPEDVTPVRKARDFAAELDGIITRFRTTLLDFPDPGTVPRTRAADVAAGYRIFANQWQSALDEAGKIGPDGWYRVGQATARDLEEITSYLSQAFTELREAAPEGTINTRDERQNYLDQARQHIQAAQDRINDLL